MIEQKCAIVFIVFYEAFSLLLDGLVDGGECSNVVQLRDARSAGTTWRLASPRLYLDWLD